MNAIGEPYPFEVHFHIFKVGSRFVTLIMGVNSFEHPTDSQVILSILIKQDVTSFQGSLSQIINQFFLFQRQSLEFRDLVPQYL